MTLKAFQIILIIFFVLEYKENKQKISKEFESIDNTLKSIDEHNIQFSSTLILYNLDVPSLKQKFKERNI
jgi:hypothetical protein